MTFEKRDEIVFMPFKHCPECSSRLDTRDEEDPRVVCTQCKKPFAKDYVRGYWEGFKNALQLVPDGYKM